MGRWGSTLTEAGGKSERIGFCGVQSGKEDNIWNVNKKEEIKKQQRNVEIFIFKSIGDGYTAYIGRDLEGHEYTLERKSYD